jgi:hypothetical protein
MAPSRVSAQATTVKTFGLEGTRYHGHAHIWDFTPSQNGGIHEVIFYRLPDVGVGYRLLTFDKDGKLDRDVALDIDFEASHIAALGDGNFVVEGRKSTPERGGHTGSPTMAIVSDQGQLLRNLKLVDDVQSPVAQNDMKSTGGNSDLAKKTEQFNQSINLSTAQTADNGNVYVLRQSPTGPLFEISSSGTVRTKQLPRYGDALINLAIVARGQLLLHYVVPVEAGEGVYKKTDTGFYSLYELGDMHKIAEYVLDPASPLRNSMPVCYESNQLSFLRVDSNHHPVLLIARPQ